MTNAILDPTGLGPAGDGPDAGASLATMTMAPRRGDLRGATVGLLATPKQNADVFIAEVGRLLREHEGAGNVVTHTKASVALPAPDELVDEMARQCDIVVTGVGDCGSCSASAVADGVIFENRGLPSAVICSDAFVATADAMAKTRGAPGYRYVTTGHPVAGLSHDEVCKRALEALPEIRDRLVAREPQGGGR